jgi:CRP-like cAMP-binding protein
MPAPVLLTAHDYLPMLMQGRWFSTIEPGLQQQLLVHAVVRKVAVHERLHSRGEVFNGIYALISGVIRISGVRGPADSGKEALLALIEAPDWFGEIPLFDHQLRTHDAWAETAAIVLHVSPADLTAILEQHPQYWRDFALLLTHKLRLTFAAIEHAAVLPAPGRLVYRLLMMSNWYGGRQRSSLQRRMLAISQEQLSQLLAISRQTTNQILKGLEQQQIIKLHRNSIEIVDQNALQALVDADSSA